MTVSIDRNRAALIIQDMQNDVIGEGGAFAGSGAPLHAAAQNVVHNCRRLADACREAGVPVIHVRYVVEDGATGLKLNAPPSAIASFCMSWMISTARSRSMPTVIASCRGSSAPSDRRAS